MKFKYYVRDTIQKVRVSNRSDYKYALMSKNSKGEYKCESCHTSLELASNKRDHLICDYLRHPWDFFEWYKPYREDFFKIIELEIR